MKTYYTEYPTMEFTAESDEVALEKAYMAAVVYREGENENEPLFVMLRDLKTELTPQSLTAEQVLRAIQEKVTQIYKAGVDDLVKLNNRVDDRYKHVETMYELDLEYYHNVARFAWAHRAKLIAMIEIQAILDDLKTKI